MLTTTEVNLDLDNAHVLSVYERDILTVALRKAIDAWTSEEMEATATGNVSLEIISRMKTIGAGELLAALDDRTVVFADLTVDLG